MTTIKTPDTPKPEQFIDPKAAVARLEELYEQATRFLCDSFTEAMQDGTPKARYRAYYPEIRIKTSSYAQVDSRLSFGHVSEPGSHCSIQPCCHPQAQLSPSCVQQSSASRSTMPILITSSARGLRCSKSTSMPRQYRPLGSNSSLS